jgi:hypothetical protein
MGQVCVKRGKGVQKGDCEKMKPFFTVPFAGRGSLAAGRPWKQNRFGNFVLNK